MKKRNILVIILIILRMICVVGYIFTLQNNNSETNNTSYNNSTNHHLNKSVDKNISLNNTNSSKHDDDLNSNYYDSSSSYGHENKKVSNDTNDSYDEAMEAKRGVEKYVLDKNEIAGYPVYKHPRLDSWLVPIFDKKTKKFISSVYVHVGPEGNYYVLGPQSYSQYKDTISGKIKHKSDLKYDNEYKSDVVEEVPDYSMRYVLAASNPNELNSQDILIPNQVVLDEECFSDSDQLMPIMESDCELNSTS